MDRPPPSDHRVERRPIPADDSELLHQLRKLYAEELDYPEEVVTEDADLEGELGLDSLSQVTLLILVLETYGMGKHATDVVGAEHPTLASIAALVRTLEAER
jgi:[acyl-carrier-protein] S-malonyltransferase